MSRLADRQHSSFDLAMDPEVAAFHADPAAWATARGLASADAAAFAAQAPRFAVYRDLVRFALEDPLPDAFPIAHALLAEAEAWDPCVAAFLADRPVQSPYYRDVAPTFLAWLAETGWGLDRWPFLLALVHWELQDLELPRLPDAPLPTGLHAVPAPGHLAIPEPTLRNLSYPWAVHHATPEAPVPEAEPAHLLAWRDAEGDFQSLALSATASALVARWLEGAALGVAANAVGVDVAEALELATRLHAEGALLGFR